MTRRQPSSTYDSPVQKRDLEAKRLRLFCLGDLHIGKFANHDTAALWKTVDAIKADKTPQKMVNLGGDFLEGHYYGHHYANALEPDKIIAQQYAEFKQVVIELTEELGAENVFMQLGNHDKSLFRLVGDLFAVEMRSDLAPQDLMPTYSGWRLSLRLRWPDGATYYIRSGHGLRSVPSQKVMRHWDQELLNVRARRNLAAVCLGWDQGVPLHDLYLYHHTHILDHYGPRNTPNGPRTDWGERFDALNCGSFYRDGECPTGDYHEEAVSKFYDVGYATVDFDAARFHNRLTGSNGEVVRKVRTPTTVQLHSFTRGAWES